MNRTRSITTAVAAAALTIGVAAPAHAESVTISDGADTPASLADIYDVTAAYRPKNLLVKVSVADLRRTSDDSPGMSLFVDTNPSRRGPEFQLGTGLTAGTDYQLLRVKKWKATGEPLTCSHSVKLNYADDVVRVTIRRSCLRKPDQVRVGVRMTDQVDGSRVTDWLKHRRAFTRWLSRG